MVSTISTLSVVRLGFAGAAVVCMVLALAGWWSMRNMFMADLELKAMQDLSLRLANTVRAVNDVILTADSKAAREAFKSHDNALRKTLADKPPKEAALRDAIHAVVEQVKVLGQLPKPSPDSDDAMIAYGKLSALVDTATAASDQAMAQSASAAEKTSKTMQSFLAIASVLSVAMVVMCAQGVQRRLRRSLGGEIEHVQALMQRVGSGDLSPIQRHPNLKESSVVGGLATMVDQLRNSIGRVKQSAFQIGEASSDIAAGSQDLSQRTELNACSLQQTASAMQELSATVGQTKEAAANAQELAQVARDVADRGGQVVGQVVQTMNDIQTSSRRIGDIISVIDGIAFQTNILALNAAVEAARAGEAGRGFAVVASEVRSLAQRSAGAAKEIKGLIQTSVDSVDSGTALVSAAGETMGEIVQSVQRVSAIIADISASAGEQSVGLATVNQSIAMLDQATQQNAALVEQSAGAAAALRDQSQTLKGVVTHFQLDASHV